MGCFSAEFTVSASQAGDGWHPPCCVWRGMETDVSAKDQAAMSLVKHHTSVYLNADLARTFQNSIFWGGKTRTENNTQIQDLAEQADYDQLVSMSYSVLKVLQDVCAKARTWELQPWKIFLVLPIYLLPYTEGAFNTLVFSFQVSFLSGCPV